MDKILFSFAFLLTTSYFPIAKAMEEANTTYSSEVLSVSSEAEDSSSEVLSWHREDPSEDEDSPPLQRLTDEIQQHIKSGDLDVALIKGIVNHDTKLVADLLAQGAPVNVGWKLNEIVVNPLLQASSKGYTEIVAMLLAANAIVDVRNNQGCTPLICASERGHLEIVRLLIGAGARINHISHELNVSALRQAAQNNHLEVAKLLIAAGAEVNAETQHTPLMAASRNGHTAMIKLLISAGAEIDQRYKDEVPALYLAAINGHAQAIETLLRAGANPNLTCENGATPFLVAAIKGRIEAAKILLQFGAQSHVQIEEKPLAIVAFEQGHIHIAELIIEHQNAIRHFGTFEKEKNTEAICPFLTEFPLLLNSPDVYGKTPLMRAAKYDNFELCREYLKAGALLHVEHFSKGLTALDYAEKRNHQGIIELLNIYTTDTLKNRVLRKIIEADSDEQSKIFDDKINQSHLSVFPSFIEIDADVIGITHEDAFGTFDEEPK